MFLVDVCHAVCCVRARSEALREISLRVKYSTNTRLQLRQEIKTNDTLVRRRSRHRSARQTAEILAAVRKFHFRIDKAL